MNTTDVAFAPQPELTQPPFSNATRPEGSYSRRPYDTLGIAWLHGSFHAAVFRREILKWAWQSPTPVRTLEEFEAALDQALVALRFGGSEVSLVLEHDSFVHKAEQAPAFSDAAARGYLRGIVERFEKEHEPVLWVSQRTVSARNEATFLLHLLPAAFYGRINGFLLARHLDLTRILPLAVPLQLTLELLNSKKDAPVLIAADTGDATTVMVAKADGELLFARTMLARWDVDPARIGVEVNRSVLYAKQQFGAVVEAIWLLGSASEEARAGVQQRCGTVKQIEVRASTPVEWLEAVAKLSPRHPVNLVAGYLGRKRRQQLIRRVSVAACWLALVLLGLDTWARTQSWSEERLRLHALQANQPALLEEKSRLQARNTEVQRERGFVREISSERLPAVPARFLAYVAGALPGEAHLTDVTVKWDNSTNKWSFRMEGQIEGEEEGMREALTSLQRTLTRSVLRARFFDATRSIVPIQTPGSDTPLALRFALEGTLFEG